jgi:hypothetical protein
MGEYGCVCGKVYKQRQSLHKHKKTCKGKQPLDPQEDSPTPTSLVPNDLVIKLIQDYKEMRDAMKQQHKFIQNQSELHQQQMRELHEQYYNHTQQLISTITATTINTNTTTNIP